MPLTTTTAEIMIVHPLGAIIWQTELDDFRAARARPVSLPTEGAPRPLVLN